MLKMSKIMICGQGGAERWSRADGICGGVSCAVPCGEQKCGHGGGDGAQEGCAAAGVGSQEWMDGLRAERVRHNCWPCARRSRAGRCGRGEAAHPQTEVLNWNKKMRSLRREGQVDHGGEDV